MILALFYHSVTGLSGFSGVPLMVPSDIDPYGQ
jgi:hypothetical protein